MSINDHAACGPEKLSKLSKAARRNKPQLRTRWSNFLRMARCYRYCRTAAIGARERQQLRRPQWVGLRSFRRISLSMLAYSSMMRFASLVRVSSSVLDVPSRGVGSRVIGRACSSVGSRRVDLYQPSFGSVFTTGELRISIYAA